MKGLFRLFLLVLLFASIAALYLFFTYDVVRTSDGYRYLEKEKGAFDFKITDTRDWNALDWLNNPDLAIRLSNSGLRDLKDTVDETWRDLSDSVNNFFEEHEGEWSNLGESLQKQFDQLRRQANEKREELKRKHDSGELSTEQFKKELTKLKTWVQEEYEQLKTKIGS